MFQRRRWIILTTVADHTIIVENRLRVPAEKL
jgi:hypothetical protein